MPEPEERPQGNRLEPGADAFHQASGWLLLAALVYAPWAFGGTRASWLPPLLWALAAAVGLWGLGLALRRQRPAVPAALIAAALFLVIYGAWMVWNARFDYDTTRHEFLPLSPPVAWAPGTLDQSRSLPVVLRLGLMLGVVCVVCDLARAALWRKRLVWTLAITGASLVLFGLVQRAADAPSIFWSGGSHGRSFFATYRYHANAGAFINLVWPVVAALALTAWRRGSSLAARLGWSAALVVCLAGVIVNASRAATVVGGILLALWLAWFGWQWLRGRFEGLHPAVGAVTLLIVTLLVGSIGVMAGLDLSLKRWGKFGEELTQQNPRLLVAGVCLDMARQSGWQGFGPGTFQTTFPFFTHRLGEAVSGTWRYAHQDYLQTIIEWGCVGAAAWAVVVFGGLAAGGRRLFHRHARPSITREAQEFALLVSAGGVLLHALVDFPLQVASIQLYVVVLMGLLWRREEAPSVSQLREMPEEMPKALAIREA